MTETFPTNPPVPYIKVKSGEESPRWENDRIRELNDVIPQLREMGLEWFTIYMPRFRSTGVVEYMYVGVPQKVGKAYGPKKAFVGWLTIDEMLADYPRKYAKRITDPVRNGKTGPKLKRKRTADDVDWTQYYLTWVRTNRPNYKELNRNYKAQFDRKQKVLRDHKRRREEDRG